MRFEKIKDKAELSRLIEHHNAASDFCALDLETTDLDPFKAKIVDIQMSGYDENHVVVLPPEYLPALRDLECIQVWHNFKYDWNVAYKHGVDLRGKPMRDTMLLHHLFDENLDHGLDDIIQSHYGDAYKELFWARYKSYESAPEADRINYACKDVYYTGLLYRYLCDQLQAGNVPESLIEHVHQLARCLFDTEITGIRIDVDYLTNLGVQLKANMGTLIPEMRALVNPEVESVELDLWSQEIEAAYTPKGKKWKTLPRPEFNWASQRQLCSLFYDKLELPVQKNKKTRSVTVDDQALETLESKHPVVAKLRELRGHQKIYGSFIEGTLERMVDSRIYPSFNINGTVTGRISSSNPNLQQLPRTGGVRGIYIPDGDKVIIGADFGQLEIMLAAHFSQDPVLLELIRSGASMHDKTAEELKSFGVNRQGAKSINFGILYGAMEYKISQIVGCSMEEAKAVLERFWSVYKGLKDVIYECHSKVDKGEPIVSPFGRRRRFPKHFDNQRTKEAAKRQAFNSLVQGTGADITNRAFYLVSQRLKETGRGRGLFVVHDEILIEVEREYASEEAQVLVNTMVGVGREIGLIVDLTAECSGPMDRWED